MDSLSVIIPTHDDAAVIGRTLASVEATLADFRGRGGDRAAVRAEVVVVDDGSGDGTPDLVQKWLAGRSGYRLIRRPAASSPATARNVGVAASGGELLLFLDGDDAFLEGHVEACYAALLGGADFVKTGVALSDPVHPDWLTPIRNSVVINLGIRRRAFEALGGFPDFHLFRRVGDLYLHEVDVFRYIEDVYFNLLVSRRFRGMIVAAETVMHYRYPGNSFDRQYAKFQLPFGQYPGEMAGELATRINLADVITNQFLANDRGPG